MGTINLFLGWTLAGWVVALVWACTERTAREEVERGGGSEVHYTPRPVEYRPLTPPRDSDMKKCPQCAEDIKAEAIKYRYCGSDIGAPPHGFTA